MSITLKKNITKTFVLIVMTIFCISAQTTTFALTAQQQKLIRQGILYYDPEECTTDSGATTTSTDKISRGCVCTTQPSNDQTTLSGDDNIEQIYNFMVSAGLPKVAAAAVVGNISQESGGDPQNIQNPGGRTKDPNVAGSAGWGIIQWTPATKILNIARDQKVTGPIYELSTQLQIVLNHMKGTSPTGYTNMFEDFKAFTSESQIDEATAYFERTMEGAGVPALENRKDFARTAYRKYKNATPTTVTAPSQTGSVSQGGKKVVIDPGHGPNKVTVDQATGLKMSESNNKPEVDDVWEVSRLAKQKLEESGYTVILTKKTVDDNVTFRERANIADDNNADIAVSIHGDPRLGNNGEIYVQKDGLNRGSGSNKTTFNDSETAKTSQEYAKIFQEKRQAAEGGEIIIKDNSFDGRPGIEPGNIPMVMLFSKTPWVYNEAKMPFNKEKYATGIVDGVKAAIGEAGVGAASDTGVCADTAATNAPTGGLSATTIAYAWPDYHPAPYIERRPAYAAAVSEAKGKGSYVGGSVDGVAGIDCGGFVTLAMINSGYEPEYNYSGKGGNTIEQIKWLRVNWKKISPSSSADVQPGDVAINADHTYMFVGKIEGFKSTTASASFGGSGAGRAPMAGHEAPADSDFEWFRKK